MNEAHLHLRNDSPSFHPVHPLIRAFGPRVLHHAKGRGLYRRLPLLQQEQDRVFPALEQLYPNAAELRAAEQLLSEDSALVNTMLRRHGQPALVEADEAPARPNLQQLSSALLLQLMAVVVQQDQRISALEQQQLAAKP